MMQDLKTVNITILDKEYLISCADEEREQLLTAAEFLHDKMHELKNSGKVIGTERIAVMTALNISNELLAYKQENDDYTYTLDTTIRRLHSKIDDALVKEGQLEI